MSCDAKLAERRLEGEIAQVRIVWKNVPGNCLGSSWFSCSIIIICDKIACMDFILLVLWTSYSIWCSYNEQNHRKYHWVMPYSWVANTVTVVLHVRSAIKVHTCGGYDLRQPSYEVKTFPTPCGLTIDGDDPRFDSPQPWTPRHWRWGY